MKTFLECIPCFVNEALNVSRRVTDDEAVQERVLRAVLAKASELSFSQSPPHMGYEIHRMIREETGNDDPYSEDKIHSNRLALGMFPDLRKKVLASDDPFETAVRLSIAGNILDFGVGILTREKAGRTLTDTVRDSLRRPFASDGVGPLRKAIEEAEDILYLGDNAGEIVFDRLLLEQMPDGKVTFVVKGGPIINDATRDDAEAAGLTSLLPVIDNGSRVPGTILEFCSPEFQRRFEAADLVIAKGQGNYETLSEVDKRIFFLLKAKCPVIARDIGCQVGDIVVSENGRSASAAKRAE